MTGEAHASKPKRENICFGCYAFSAYNAVKIQNLFFGYTQKLPRKRGKQSVWAPTAPRRFAQTPLKRGRSPLPHLFSLPKRKTSPTCQIHFLSEIQQKLQHIFIFTKARKHYRQHRKKQNKRPLARQENIFLGKRGREKQNFKSCGALGYDTA